MPFQNSSSFRSPRTPKTPRKKGRHYGTRNDDFEINYEDDNSQDENEDLPLSASHRSSPPSGSASSFFKEKPHPRFKKFTQQFENLLDIQELKQGLPITQARISADSSRLLVIRKRSE